MVVSQVHQYRGQQEVYQNTDTYTTSIDGQKGVVTIWLVGGPAMPPLPLSSQCPVGEAVHTGLPAGCAALPRRG